MNGRGKKLETLATEMGITHKVTHRAYDDALVTANVFIKFSICLDGRESTNF